MTPPQIDYSMVVNLQRRTKKTDFCHARELEKGHIRGASGPPPGAKACSRGRCATPKARPPGFEPACARSCLKNSACEDTGVLHTPTRVMRGCPVCRTRKAGRCSAFPSCGVVQRQRVHCGGARGVPWRPLFVAWNRFEDCWTPKERSGHALWMVDAQGSQRVFPPLRGG